MKHSYFKAFYLLVFFLYAAKGYETDVSQDNRALSLTIKPFYAEEESFNPEGWQLPHRASHIPDRLLGSWTTSLKIEPTLPLISLRMNFMELCLLAQRTALLTSLEITDVDEFSGDVLKEFLKRNSLLRKISIKLRTNELLLADNNILSMITECCPYLNTLILEGTNSINTEGIEELAKLAHLETLELSDISIPPDQLKIFYKLTKLQTLRLKKFINFEGCEDNFDIEGKQVEGLNGCFDIKIIKNFIEDLLIHLKELKTLTLHEQMNLNETEVYSGTSWAMKSKLLESFKETRLSLYFQPVLTYFVYEVQVSPILAIDHFERTGQLTPEINRYKKMLQRVKHHPSYEENALPRDLNILQVHEYIAKK